MTKLDILPLGQHRLDPGPDFDPIRSLLLSLWIDLWWTNERCASIVAHLPGDTIDPGGVNVELSYLRGDLDDALQHLARLIELLLTGYAVDPAKRISQNNAPPFFREGRSLGKDEIVPLGRYRLDPPAEIDPIRHFLTVVKANLVRVDAYRTEYEARRWKRRGVEMAASRLRKSAEDTRQDCARLIELLLAGHTIDPGKRGPAESELRLFKAIHETEWLACSDMSTLCRMLRPLDYGVEIRFSERKWRLLGSACVRRVAGAFKDTRTLKLLEAVEQLAEGLITREELEQLWKEVLDPPNLDVPYPRGPARQETAAVQAYWALCHARHGEAAEAHRCASYAQVATAQPALEQQAQAALLRDVFGNPFRPMLLDPLWLAWNDGTVPRIARAIYDGRSFDQMPILADALEEAGCTDPDLLAHCRESDHVRGCWALDLLLGLT